MDMPAFPFDVVDWSTVEPEVHPGVTGTATWRVRDFGKIRVRFLEYSPGYRADHWCSKGHVLYVLDGQLDTELQDGRRFTLLPGQSYQVGDNAEAHLSSTEKGAKLFVVD
ncbi:MAG: DHCW motif cupin fold protein [Rhodospirillaceae bacterium]